MTNVEMFECPGEAHVLDYTFNPGSQGPYGYGYHDCDICDNECYVIFDVYIEEIKWQEQKRQWREERKVVNKLMAATQSMVS